MSHRELFLKVPKQCGMTHTYVVVMVDRGNEETPGRRILPLDKKTEIILRRNERMRCAHCHTEYREEDIYCRQCGADLTETSTSVVPIQRQLPALLYNSPLPRNVAASVGALALGVGIELLRRGVLARLSKAPLPVESTLPMLGGLKDVLLPRNEKPAKRRKKGYQVEETVIYMRRVTHY